ncbi:Ribonuclease H-like superfamily protein [Rhynchospora pubera]|uniref:Ribonuclease H-like superfamily protein n=1 Tax=Rhynchospora pubera TaxID=906938 RepID=A0AAV8GG36_9POAL|nr:Ribonuclease H-like superfamily protein [Rhynchospora pubera]
MQQLPQNFKSLYKAIWHSKGILPRVRLFLWKITNSALPLDHLFATRLGKQPQGCSLCGEVKEDVVHSIFKCHLARQVWLSSSLGIRTDALPDSAADIMVLLSTLLDEKQFKSFAAIAWNLWKQRCRSVYDGKTFHTVSVIHAAGGMIDTLSKAEMLHSGQLPARHQPFTDSVPVLDFYCHIDGSWVAQGDGGSGWAYVLFNKDGSLIEYGCGTGNAFLPIHSEIQALKAAFMAVKARGINPALSLWTANNFRKS